jgi:beta-carotene hydroxylase
VPSTTTFAAQTQTAHRVVDPIEVDRAWIGATPGTLGNPTVWLFAAWLLLFAIGSAGYLSGRLSPVVQVPLHALAAYVAFTVLHDGMHGVAHANRSINATLARLSGAVLTIPLPLFRAVHLEHHSHTNDPKRDPDFVVARAPRLALPLWLLAVVVEYRLAFYGRKLWRSTSDLVEAVATDVALVALVAAAVAGGWWRPLILLWLLPALLAVLFLALFFDFVPHYPFDTRARYFDTRIYPGAALNVVLLGQNYHLIHHLWTTIPWYRYRRVFGTVHPALAARGCRIGWRVTPRPREISEA